MLRLDRWIMTITIVITKDGLIRLIEECYKYEDPLEKLAA